MKKVNIFQNQYADIESFSQNEADRLREVYRMANQTTRDHLTQALEDALTEPRPGYEVLPRHPELKWIEDFPGAIVSEHDFCRSEGRMTLVLTSGAKKRVRISYYRIKLDDTNP